MKRLLNAAARAAVIGTLLSGSAIAGAQPVADADPAMWVVKDADTTIYLFGTFHALDGKTEWLNDEVKAAFDASDELVLEVIAPEDPAAMAPVMQKYAMDTSGKTLREKLSPQGREKLTKALAAMGAPADAFDKLKPFFAALTLTVMESQKLGMTNAQGSEAVLTKAAKAASKPIGNLESVDFQIKMMADLPEKSQIEMLEQTLDQAHEMGKSFERMKALWTAGDAEGFAKLMHEMNASSPEAYDAIFTKRNANWAEWVDKRLDKPGTVFVAVGTGHLAGKNSVQELLEKRGIKSADAN
ncbi:MAG TPA: TraB/GumN family protein [Sphingomicrobium sp.]|nr:TraB/GumN family protein [Sphingomicrobium sp.]